MSWNPENAKRLIVFIVFFIVFNHLIGIFKAINSPYLDMLPEHYLFHTILLNLIMIVSGLFAIKISKYSQYLFAFAVSCKALPDILGITVFVPKTYFLSLLILAILVW